MRLLRLDIHSKALNTLLKFFSLSFSPLCNLEPPSYSFNLLVWFLNVRYIICGFWLVSCRLAVLQYLRKDTCNIGGIFQLSGKESPYDICLITSIIWKDPTNLLNNFPGIPFIYKYLVDRNTRSPTLYYISLCFWSQHFCCKPTVCSRYSCADLELDLILRINKVTLSVLISSLHLNSWIGVRGFVAIIRKEWTELDALVGQWINDHF